MPKKKRNSPRTNKTRQTLRLYLHAYLLMDEEFMNQLQAQNKDLKMYLDEMEKSLDP